MSEQTTKSGFRWGRWLLIFSLALNLIFIGFAATAFLKFKKWKGSHHGFAGVERMAGYMFKKYPEDRRAEFMKIIRSKKGEFENLKGQGRAAREELRKLMEAESFQAAKVREVVANIGIAKGQRKRIIADLIVDVMAKMTAEERKTFVRSRWMRRFLRKGRRGRRRH